MKTKSEHKDSTKVERTLVIAIVVVLILMALLSLAKHIKNNYASNYEQSTAIDISKAAVTFCVENALSENPYSLWDTLNWTFDNPQTVNSDINDNIKSRIEQDINLEVRMYFKIKPTSYEIHKRRYKSKWLLFLPGSTDDTIAPFGDIYLVSPNGEMYINGIRKK